MPSYVYDLRVELGHLRNLLSVIAAIRKPHLTHHIMCRIWHKSLREYLCREEIARCPLGGTRPPFPTSSKNHQPLPACRPRRRALPFSSAILPPQTRATIT